MKHAPYAQQTTEGNNIFMRMAEEKLEEKKLEPQPETLTERVERESLRVNGVLKKELPTITRSTLNSLSPQTRMDFMRAGGKLTDDPAPTKQPLPEGALRRSAFDRLSHAEKVNFSRSGRRLVDDHLVEDKKKDSNDGN
jgi:hypothetical protein